MINVLFNDTATAEIYTLSLHDALPISLDERDALAAEHDEALLGVLGVVEAGGFTGLQDVEADPDAGRPGDRKSTRLNSSHMSISYAVFCLKKKKKTTNKKITG